MLQEKTIGFKEEESFDEYYVFPASFAQKRYYFLDKLLTDSSVYNIPLFLSLNGELNIPALKQTIFDLINKHEALRTNFTINQNELVQVIKPRFKSELTIKKFQNQFQANKLMGKEAKKPFDLNKGPLFRVTLLTDSHKDHFLLINMHHIISDGWSVDILFKEFLSLYKSFLDCSTSNLTEPPFQYADYSMWQEEQFQKGILQHQLHYWKEKLNGDLPVLQMPSERPRPKVVSNKGAYYEFTIPEFISKEISQLCKVENCTLFIGMLTTFNILISRYTQQEDIVVGTPIANRNRSEFEKTVGLFANTLAIRTDLSANPTFIELLNRVREVTLEAYDNQDIPFEKIVEELNPNRSTSHTPIFQTMFLLNNKQEIDWELPGLEIKPVKFETDTAKFELTLDMETTTEGLKGVLEYQTDLFDKETIINLVDHFKILLTDIVQNPEKPIRELQILTKLEREKLVTCSTKNPIEPLCSHELFEIQAKQYPSSIAVTFEDDSITYKELNRKANQLAHYLQKKGVGPEVLVGLCVERSIDLVVGVLGILKAGGAYVPIDPSNPNARLEYIIQDAGINLLVTQSHLENKFLNYDIQSISLDEIKSAIKQESTENSVSLVQPDNLAYVIYTSGSTGNPKGTLIPHKNIPRLFSSSYDWYRFDNNDTWTLFHSYAFDFSVWEIWGALLYGGRLVIVPYWVSRDTEKFYDLLIQEKVTILNQTPSAFYQLMKVDKQRLLTTNVLNLRYVIFGGETLNCKSLRPWFDKHGDQKPLLVNMYGITETTVHVTYRPINLRILENEIRNVIGVPIPDLHVFVLDNYKQPMPNGLQGEIYVGGAGLARGYLNQPELTSDRFIDNPFSQEPKKLYRTGDLGKIISNGEIEYCGRIDNQVKVRGFRIELGEIEAKLSLHPGVREAIVIAKEDIQHNTRLIAYIVSSDTITSKELRRFLSELLPEHMVPSQFINIEAFPLTNNGKVDINYLPSSINESNEFKDVYIGPENEIEKSIMNIWSNILDRKFIGINDNYFELGGDSIKSIIVLSSLKEHGFNLEMQDLFLYQTIRELALHVRKKDDSPIQLTKGIPLVSENDLKRIPDNIEDIYPLTKLQEGMLYHSEVSNSARLYLNISSLKISAPYSEKKWVRAIDKLFSRHPILRTSFDFTYFSEPMQLVHKKVQAPIVFTDISHLSEDEQKAEIERVFEIEKDTPFNWAEAPLLRIKVQKISESCIQMMIIEHHAILDGWSVASLHTELFSLYQAEISANVQIVNNKPKALFKDYVELERNAVQDLVQKDFWINKLFDMTLNKIPRWNLGKSKTEMNILEVNIPKELSDGIRGMATNSKVHVKSVLLAAHFKVLSMLSASKDIVSGVVYNGRVEEIDGEKVLGLFLNTLPMRQHISEGTWLDLIKTTAQEEQNLLKYRRYPMSQIQLDIGTAELFETFFNFTNFYIYRSIEDLKDIDVFEESEISSTNFPFGVEFGQDLFSMDIVMSLRWDLSEFNEEQIDLIGKYYLNVLNSMVDNPQQKIDSVYFLTELEHNRIVDWNDTKKKYNEVHILHKIIETQVEKSPNHLALKFESEELTYIEMNNKSNFLAEKLIKQGVQPGDYVGVCLDRSINMVISLLGILKAGAAYVPIDPESPRGRVRDLIANSGISILITSQKFKEQVSDCIINIQWVEELDKTLINGFINNPNVHMSQRNVAYMIYTSGSTGKPKGVMVSHQAICNRLLWKQDYFKLRVEDKVLQKTPYTFDVSVWEFFWPLITGACLVIAKPDGHRDSHYLLNLIQDEQISTIHFVPSMLQEIVEEDIGKCTSLKRVLCSGESLPFDLQQRFFEKSSSDLFNLYGPTEAAVDVSYWKCERDGIKTVVPIGKPISNIQLYILNSQLKPVPIGAIGELYIGGIGLAEGYHQLPELTKEKFIPSPLSNKSKELLYQTGDLARYFPDGSIEYRGRMDSQVKIRGVRVELEEIETVISTHPSVRECTVLYIDKGKGLTFINAYLVANKNTEINIREVTEYVKHILPEYMLPLNWSILESMPLTPSGKVNRIELSLLENEGNRVEIISPRDMIEWKLFEIWREMFNNETFSVKDSFFSVGGHSLLALRMMAIIKKEFSKQISLSMILQNDTIEKMAIVIRDEYESNSKTALVKIQSGKLENKTPLFLVHPVGGNILCYKPLVDALGNGYTIYGIQSPATEIGINELKTIEEISDYYIKEIKKIQPKGPYCIAGWSFGGVIAYEIARNLTVNGDQIKILAMMDSYLMKFTKNQIENEDFYIDAFVNDLLYSLDSDRKKELLNAIKLSSEIENKLDPILCLLVNEKILPETDFEQFVEYYNMFKSNLYALSKYEPLEYEGPILYFRALNTYEEHMQDPNKWGIQTLNLNLHDIKTDHYHLIQLPHSDYIAEEIKLLL
ncbi:amino acid adenylation domain-containing protein [Sporosarcina psychrophila]|uniref:Amino acid adenylation domain-containing protein n=1 Tax=Sporosarcina psychrophila TaxID=1476 RepID=A0ABV2KD79_SPOPS